MSLTAVCDPCSARDKAIKEYDRIIGRERAPVDVANAACRGSKDVAEGDFKALQPLFGKYQEQAAACKGKQPVGPGKLMATPCRAATDLLRFGPCLHHLTMASLLLAIPILHKALTGPLHLPLKPTCTAQACMQTHACRQPGAICLLQGTI